MKPAEIAPEKPQRLLSLDAFRGLTIAGMVLVNNPGTWKHLYEPLQHASWNGCTPTDLVFPFFLFMVGVSVAFSYTKHLAAGTPKSQLLRKVIVRSANIYILAMLLILFYRTKGKVSFKDFQFSEALPCICATLLIFGLFFLCTYQPRKKKGTKSTNEHSTPENGNAGNFSPGKWILRIGIAFAGLVLLYIAFNATDIKSVSDVRLVGVLPRISFVFLVCAVLYLYTSPRIQVLLCALFLIGYCFCMQGIGIPGRDGEIVMEPGRNFAAWVDSKIVPGKMYRGPHNPVGTWEEDMLRWDPEGFFSTIPAFASGLIGVFAGMLVLSRQSPERKIIWLFFAGSLLSIGGYCWGQFFPINKHLWTSSYVLLTSGFACTGLAACMFFIDMLGFKSWGYVPIVFGSNAITIFALSGMLAMFFYGGEFKWNVQVMNALIEQGFSEKFASFAYAAFYVAVNFVPAWILYRFRIYVRL